MAWAQEAGRLVVSCIFEDMDVAAELAGHVNAWNDRFSKMTIIEEESEYAICCHQDPLASGEGPNVGIYRPGLPRIGGYERAKELFRERPPMLQLAFAADYTRMETYQQVSRLILPGRSRIIDIRDLRRQEYYYERVAHDGSTHIEHDSVPDGDV